MVLNACRWSSICQSVQVDCPFDTGGISRKLVVERSNRRPAGFGDEGRLPQPLSHIRQCQFCEQVCAYNMSWVPVSVSVSGARR